MILVRSASLGMAYGLCDILAGNSAMPANLFVYPQRFIHEILSNLMMALATLHVSAALYHQFIRKDNLLARMWFGVSASNVPFKGMRYCTAHDDNRHFGVTGRML